LVETIGGVLLVPSATSYDAAPAEAAHDSEVDAVTPVAPLAGDGLLGEAGGAAIVVKDHTGPAVDPPVPLAVTCQ
jgi:hypothetical protein